MGQRPNQGHSPTTLGELDGEAEPRLVSCFLSYHDLSIVWVAPGQCRRRAACARLRPSSLYV